MVNERSIKPWANVKEPGLKKTSVATSNCNRYHQLRLVCFQQRSNRHTFPVSTSHNFTVPSSELVMMKLPRNWRQVTALRCLFDPVRNWWDDALQNEQCNQQQPRGKKTREWSRTRNLWQHVRGSHESSPWVQYRNLAQVKIQSLDKTKMNNEIGATLGMSYLNLKRQTNIIKKR